ncbi:hypothetical protein HMPREF6123_0226 [Oribacterium sinus F0268]|uniref:Uncharacterized protein n=1 Tax=Oribacterium sinus F0268 TaxID=585501 RepID=C2KUQ7_9FIRM|nr:hypothetical protein HMPREF6123_0226 [Oribacterium sinus F0268]
MLLSLRVKSKKDCKNQNREFSEIYCLENSLISLQFFFCELFWKNTGAIWATIRLQPFLML